jgi:carbamoyl-phosphate synthase large subunit
VSRLAPALHKADKAHVLPRLSANDYSNALQDLVRREKIDLLVPLIDLELLAVAAAVDRLADLGCCALISSERVVRTCRDKMATFEALRAAGIDTPSTWLWDDAVKRKRHTFPYFLKPRSGSAAMGNFVVRNRDELFLFGRRVHEPIVQEFVEGIEHTLDVYTGFDGKPRCVVPRRRLEVRGGEVSKALVVKDPALMAMGRRVAEMLGECRGVVTMQCIVTPADRIRVIEVNPRFGGGVPLAIKAGADFPKWILSELIGRKPRIDPMGFRDDIAMLRFDDSVFVPKASGLIQPDT